MGSEEVLAISRFMRIRSQVVISDRRRRLRQAILDGIHADALRIVNGGDVEEDAPYWRQTITYLQWAGVAKFEGDDLLVHHGDNAAAMLVEQYWAEYIKLNIGAPGIVDIEPPAPVVGVTENNFSQEWPAEELSSEQGEATKEGFVVRPEPTPITPEDDILTGDVSDETGSIAAPLTAIVSEEEGEIVIDVDEWGLLGEGENGR